jgi:hypothetical protein
MAIQETVGDAPAEPSSASKRRQAESGGPPHKRLRYVAQACDHCKRQKVRCNGRKPCNRCEKLRPRECCYQGRQHLRNCPEYTGSMSSGALAEENGKVASTPDDPSSSDLSLSGITNLLLRFVLLLRSHISSAPSAV